MKLEQSFEVKAPLEKVWEALIDVERVAPCLPGAEITEAQEDGSYHGNFTVKLGPTTAAYRGQLRLESVDEGSHHVTMKASGQDKRGQGSAKATIVSALHADADGTRVEVETDFTLTGRLARFGRGGMIKDVSNKLMGDFSRCLAQSIEAAPAAEEPPLAVAAESAAQGDKAAAGPAPPTSAPPRPAPAKPVKGLSLLLSVLWTRIKRLFGSGG